MNTPLRVCVLLLVLCSPALAAENVSQSRLADAVKYLASDDLGGRGVGTEGIDQAADYLAAQFKELGLRTDVIDGSPFQPFTINTEAVLGPKEKNTLSFVGPRADGKPQTIELPLEESFTPLAIGGSSKLDMPIVFVGYGITAKDPAYDEYADIDVKGKIVIVMRKEPQQNNPHSPFNGDKNTQHAFFRTKTSNAYEHGAAGVILVNDSRELETRAKAALKEVENATEALAKAKADWAEIKEPTEEQTKEHKAEIAKLEQRLQGAKAAVASNHDTLMKFSEAGPSSPRKKFPVLFATRQAIDELLQASVGKSLIEFEKQIDKDLKPVSVALEGWKAVGSATVEQREAKVKNVIAVLEGEGPLADETIVIGAHYDHLGMGGTGSLAPWTKAIHNGADDNASGTAALLEVARQIVAQKKKPARRLVFIAFTGEERGLLGSAHYVREPVFPLENTVAMVNMDMVGRLKDNKLIVQGHETAKSFEELIDTLNETAKFEIVKKSGGFGPSDHSSFYAKKIPVFHIFTGTHKDYHRPTDDFEKVNVEGMARIVDYVAALVSAIDAGKARPEYVEIKRKEIAPRGGSRPYLGTIPDFGVEVEGYALQGVVAGGPAAKGGVRGGDVIIKFGDSKIGSLEDIDSALRKFKAGDKVKVTVLREKKEVVLTVTLGAPR